VVHAFNLPAVYDIVELQQIFQDTTRLHPIVNLTQPEYTICFHIEGSGNLVQVGAIVEVNVQSEFGIFCWA